MFSFSCVCVFPCPTGHKGPPPVKGVGCVSLTTTSLQALLHAVMTRHPRQPSWPSQRGTAASWSRCVHIHHTKQTDTHARTHAHTHTQIHGNSHAPRTRMHKSRTHKSRTHNSMETRRRTHKSMETHTHACTHMHTHICNVDIFFLNLHLTL